MTSFYGSSCADNGKGALDTPETLPLFTPCVQFPTFSHRSPTFGPAYIDRSYHTVPPLMSGDVRPLFLYSGN
eukprot:8668755-Pyramimonas_sp.AAC.1